MPQRDGYWCKKIRGVLHYFCPRWKPRDAGELSALAWNDDKTACDPVRFGPSFRVQAGR
jgi:hypothetical protein